MQGVDEIETPVKASLRLKEALESSDPATAGNAEILAELQAVRTDMERMRATRESPAGFVYNPRSWPTSGLPTQPGPVVTFSPGELVDPSLYEWQLSGSQGDPPAGPSEDREEDPKPRKGRGRPKPKSE